MAVAYIYTGDENGRQRLREDVARRLLLAPPPTRQHPGAVGSRPQSGRGARGARNPHACSKRDILRVLFRSVWPRGVALRAVAGASLGRQGHLNVTPDAPRWLWKASFTLRVPHAAGRDAYTGICRRAHCVALLALSSAVLPRPLVGSTASLGDKTPHERRVTARGRQALRRQTGGLGCAAFRIYVCPPRAVAGDGALTWARRRVLHGAGAAREPTWS